MSIKHRSTPAQQTELIEAWLQDLLENKATSTIESYGENVCRAHAELPEGVMCATADEIRAWISRPGRAPATRKAYRSALVSFFEWATDPAGPRLDFNPMPLVPTVSVMRGKPRPISPEVLADILNRAPEPHRLWYTLAAGAGLRCVEISRLDREHITRESVWVQGKGGAEAFVPTHPQVWAAVQDLPSGPVARNVDGSRADRINVRARGNKMFTRLGYADVTMHRLRHFFGSQVRRAAGGDLRIAQEGLRHADPKDTATYTDWLDTKLVAAVHAVPLSPTTRR